MLCPFCSTQLQVVNRHSVEIDWCPSCKGVWLERGELDKLIEQAAAATAPVSGSRPFRRDDDDDDDDDDDRYRAARYPANGAGAPVPKKKRRGFLSEIFDFD